MFRINSWNNLNPGLSIVLGFVEVRSKVAALVASSCKIGLACCKGACLNGIDLKPFGQVFRSHILPVFSIVSGHMHQSIIWSSPDYPFGNRRFRSCEDGGIVLYRGVVLGDGSSRWTEFALVVSGQVRREYLPRLSFVSGAVKLVTGCVE